MPVPDPILDGRGALDTRRNRGCASAHSTMLSCNFDLIALRIKSSTNGW